MATKLSLSTFFNSLNTKDIVLKYLVIIFLGALIFYFDDQEIVDPAMNTLFILILSFGKTSFFVVQSLRKISHVINKNVAYFRFLLFMMVNILAIIISFGVDFFCLYIVDHSNFSGNLEMLGTPGLIFEFIYLSMLGFNNLGFYDVTPISMATKVLVMVEIMIYYFTIILILSDFVSLRDSILEERMSKKVNEDKN